jgi:hypothetical protein
MIPKESKPSGPLRHHDTARDIQYIKHKANYVRLKFLHNHPDLSSENFTKNISIYYRIRRENSYRRFQPCNGGLTFLFLDAILVLVDIVQVVYG